MTTYTPIFGKKNHISDVDHITDSAGTTDSVRRKLFDRNKEYQWSSVGEVSGTSTLTYTPGVSKNARLIGLQNHNLKAFTIKYNTSSDFSPAISVSGNTTETSHFWLVTEQAFNTLDISITDTIAAGETRKIGQLYVSEELYTIPDSMAGNLNLPAPLQKNSIIELSDGTVNNVYVRSILNWNLAMLNVSAAERLNIKDIFDYHRRSPFFFIPRPATPSDSWDGIGEHMIWANAPDFERFTEDHAVSGYDVNIQLLQAGGI